MINNNPFIRPVQDWSTRKVWKILPNWAKADFITVEPTKYPELWQVMSSDVFTKKSWQAILKLEHTRFSLPSVRPFGEFLKRAKSGPDAATLLGAKARKKIVQSIVKDARKLCDCLEMLDRAGFYEQGIQISDLTMRDLVSRAASEHSSRELPKFALNSDSWVEGLFALLTHPDAYLRTISARAEQWDAEVAKNAFVKHVNSNDRDALHFLRVMTRGFCVRYRTPLREPTLQLGSVFFPKYCENLTSAGLQKVCPNPFEVNKKGSLPSG
jgi:hypothetical protein